MLTDLQDSSEIADFNPIDVAHYYEALSERTRELARSFAKGVATNREEEERAYKSELRQAENYKQMADRLERLKSVTDDDEIFQDLERTREQLLWELRRGIAGDQPGYVPGGSITSWAKYQ